MSLLYSVEQVGGFTGVSVLSDLKLPFWLQIINALAFGWYHIIHYTAW